MKPLIESKFLKLQAMLGLQEVAIIKGCIEKLISPLESLECCDDVGV